LESGAREDHLHDGEEGEPEEEDPDSGGAAPGETLLRDAIGAAGVSRVSAGERDAREVEPQTDVQEDGRPDEDCPPEGEVREESVRWRVFGKLPEERGGRCNEEPAPEEHGERETPRRPEVCLEKAGRLGDDSREDGPGSSVDENAQQAARQEDLEQRKRKEGHRDGGFGDGDLVPPREEEGQHSPAVPALYEGLAEGAFVESLEEGLQGEPRDERGREEREPENAREAPVAQGRRETAPGRAHSTAQSVERRISTRCRAYVRPFAAADGPSYFFV